MAAVAKAKAAVAEALAGEIQDHLHSASSLALANSAANALVGAASAANIAMGVDTNGYSSHHNSLIAAGGQYLTRPASRHKDIYGVYGLFYISCEDVLSIHLLHKS
jgi:hypothetical protein